MRISSLFILLFVSILLRAQDPRLAEQYFQDGEYEKASALYEQLFKQNNGDFYFNRMVDCLVNQSKYTDAQTLVSKQLKKEPKKVSLYVQLGLIYEKESKQDEADEQFKKAIDKLTDDRFTITQLASVFTENAKFDLALRAYERGGELLKDNTVFALNLAELYRRKDNIPKMVESYLNSMKDNPSNGPTVQSFLQRYLAEKDYPELQSQLYALVQKDPNAVQYAELLSWVFMQKKDYRNAFRQAKAIDRQLEEGGTRVFSIAQIALNDKDYDSAIEGYEYIIKEKGPQSGLYIEAKKNYFFAKRQRLTEGYSYTKDDLRLLDHEYDAFLTEVGKSKLTASIMVEQAELNAIYINDLDKSISLLNDVINFPGIDRVVQAKSKISLADYYLMKGENWEATLLYSQVDKAFKEDALGAEARFRNAKLSYYVGDFEWAQSQFDVLKASTSKLISNDAIDMSVFISENIGIDSNMEALEMYAQAELLVFQNKFDSAFIMLDTITKNYPEHSIVDDILYLKAQIFQKRQEYTKAVAFYQVILDKYNDGIRADNSLWEMGKLYEGPLQDKQKAKDIYEKLFTNYSGSMLAIDARKRFRALRGDKVE